MTRYLMIVLSLTALLGLAACSDQNDSLTAPVAGADTDKSAVRGLGAENRAPAPGGQTIAEIAEEAGFSLLLAAVGHIAENNPESDLVAGLLDRSQLTVFAPTDDAFVALVDAVAPLLDPEILDQDGPFAAIDDLLGTGTIEAVVSYHVTEGRRAANSVVPRRGVRTIETILEGAALRVDPAGTITAVGSTAGIAAANISASNGIIHVIDAVLLPIDLGL
jgi:uncharacterized surface protein with fasciclin (FAS1) repeats